MTPPDGTLRMMTFAPELAGADAFVEPRHLRAGSSSAWGTPMPHARRPAPPFAPERDRRPTPSTPCARSIIASPGIVGAVFTEDDLFADLIADGVHVAPEVIRLFLQAKGEERAILITDAISATGMPDGKYPLGPFVVEVKGDRCEIDGKLAGSVLTLDRAMRNVMQFDARSLARAVRLATQNPAQLLGLRRSRPHRSRMPRRSGRPEPRGEVRQTLIGGRAVARAS